MGYARKTEKEAALTSFAEFRALLKQYDQEKRNAWEIARWQEWHQMQMNPYIKPHNKPKTPKSMMPFPWEEEEAVNNVTKEQCYIDDATREWLEGRFKEYYKDKQVN